MAYVMSGVLAVNLGLVALDIDLTLSNTVSKTLNFRLSFADDLQAACAFECQLVNWWSEFNSHYI